jgi:RHS repeat-associated protein
LKLGNGRFETAEFNSRQQLTQIGLGSNANDTSLFKLDYEYGELTANGTIQNTGNITKQTITLPNASFVQTYKYDSLVRLTEAKETTGTSATENWKQTFGYDRFGNRTAFSQQISGQNLAINSQTLPSIDTTSNRFNLNQGFIYDKTGNIIQDIDRVTGQPRRFVFNGENKQVEIRNPNLPSTADPIARYYYDGNGARVKKETSLEKTIFVYDGHGKLVAEYSTQLSQNPTTSYLTTDHLGTPRIITDKNGNVISRRDMMPFGEDLYAGVGGRTGDNGQKYSSSQDEIRQKFTGYLKDKETNLDFAEARYYINLFGRFTAVDPLLASGKSDNPQTFNRYVYALNSPFVYTDPNGEKPVWVSGKKGHRHYEEAYFEGATRYRGGAIRVYGTLRGNQHRSYYIVREDGIFTQARQQVVARKTTPVIKPEPTGYKNTGLINGVLNANEKQLTATKYAAVAVGTVGACVMLCGPAIAIAGPSIVGAATNPVAGPAIGLTIGIGGGIAGANALSNSNPGNSETTTDATPTPSPTPDDSLIRVGRWMAGAELDKMTNTGTVQEGGNGITNVLFPSNCGCYNAAPSGDMYVEFSLPGDVIETEVMRPKGGGQWFMFGPNSFPARNGRPVPPLPPATNIEVIKRKP